MSKKKNTDVIHLMAKRKFWSGQVTALCGHVAERGQYDTAMFGFWSGARCTDCQGINRQHKKRKR